MFFRKKTIIKDMSNKRPLGISTYAYLTITMAVLNMLIYTPFARNISIRSLIIISNTFYISVGIGLLLLRKWARISLLTISWIFIFLFLLILFKSNLPISTAYFILFGLFIYLFGVFYFTRNKIKKQFI